MTPKGQGVLDGEALLVVVEVRENLHARAPGGDPALPALELGLGIIATTTPRALVEPHERPVGGQLMSLERALGRVADHKRGVVAAKQVVDGRVEPALVAKLEAVAPRRKLLQGRGEALVVTVEVGGELPQHRAHLRRLDERLDPLVEALEPATKVGEPLHVGQVTARLDREQESGRCLLDPPGDGSAGGEPVEGVVDLDRVEQRRVVLEPPGGRKALRIDPAAPVVVVPAGTSDPDLPHPRSASASCEQISGVAAATTRDRPSVSSGASSNGGDSGRSIASPHSRIRS